MKNLTLIAMAGAAMFWFLASRRQTTTTDRYTAVAGLRG